MNKNVYLIVNRQKLLNALKTLKKISERPSKINVMRLFANTLEFCATNGQEAIKTSINSDNNFFEGTEKEYILSTSVVDNFISFLEIKSENENISISIDKDTNEMTFFQNKNAFITAQYLTEENACDEISYLLKTPVYIQLINDEIKINNNKNIFIPLAACDELTSISSAFQNEYSLVAFRYDYNKGVSVETSDMCVIMRYNINLPQHSLNEIKNFLQEKLENRNLLFALSSQTFKNILSLIAGNDSNKYDEASGIYFNLDGLKHKRATVKIEKDGISLLYACPLASGASLTSRLDSIFKNSEFEYNFFTLNIEDVETIIAMAPLLDKQCPSVLLEFDLLQKDIKISNGDCAIATSFLIKRKISEYSKKGNEVDALKGLFFIKSIMPLKKYFRALQKNKNDNSDDIIFRFRTNGEKNAVIMAYYVQTENLQYCFAGGTIKNID